jgi:hypothetical protein
MAATLYTAARAEDNRAMKKSPAKRSPRARDWLPLSGERVPAEVPTGQAFRTSWIDFEHGIRVGNLEPHERITQILRWNLEERWTTRFVTDRWGRGVFWHWICWVPRENREAKPLSNTINWGCAKFYIMMDHDRDAFAFGMSVERGTQKKPPRDYDWHLFVEQCRRGSALDQVVRCLVHEEGFSVALYGAAPVRFEGNAFTSLDQVRRAMEKVPRGGFLGFDLCYAMPRAEVHGEKGADLVQAILAGFAATAPAMNLCMAVPLTARDGGSVTPSGRTPAPRPRP